MRSYEIVSVSSLVTVPSILVAMKVREEEMLRLGILLFVALGLSVYGFWMYVYFFSIGYGFSIAGIGIALVVMFYSHLTLGTVIMCILLIAYGLRLGGYLLLREMKSTAYKKLLKTESRSKVALGAKFAIWISCALLYMCECAPVLFRMEAGKADDIFAIVGILFMASGILMEFFADLQKAKAKKTNPERFVSTGLYRLVRCPNYFGEILLWTGVLISGLNVYHTVLQWVVVLLGYIGILYKGGDLVAKGLNWITKKIGGIPTALDARLLQDKAFTDELLALSKDKNLAQKALEIADAAEKRYVEAGVADPELKALNVGKAFVEEFQK